MAPFLSKIMEFQERNIMYSCQVDYLEWSTEINRYYEKIQHKNIDIKYSDIINRFTRYQIIYF